MVDAKRYAHNGYSICFEWLHKHYYSYQTSSNKTGLGVDSSFRWSPIFMYFQQIKYHICSACIKSPFYVNLDVDIYQNYIGVKKEKESISFCVHDKEFGNNEGFHSFGTIKDLPAFIHKLHVIALAQFKAIVFGNTVGKIFNSLPRILFIPHRNISMISYRLSYNRVN